MQESEVSKIEQSIRQRILEEKDLALRDLIEATNNTIDRSIERINGVYTSAINTLKNLDIRDSTFIDIFERTKGNVRVYEGVIPRYNRTIEIHVGGRTLGYDTSNPGTVRIQPIQLSDNKTYKIVVMAIEEGDILKPEER